MACSLNHVIRGCKERASSEGKDDRIGVKWTQSPEVGPFRRQEFRPDELSGDKNSDSHSYDTPDDGHDREMTNGSVVVRRVCDSVRHPDPSFYDKNIYS